MTHATATPDAKRARQPKVARRNPDASRKLILAAAADEFTEHGLNGARIDRVAVRSGFAKNLIYHYFGSKDGLYLAVLEQIYRDMRTSQGESAVRDMPPAEGMRQLVLNTFDHFARTPALIRLMSIENIHNARHLKQSHSVKPLYRPLLDTLRHLLARGAADGTFRAGVDPVDLYISISGLAYFYLSNSHSLSWIFGENLTADRRRAARREHVADMVLAYLTQGAEGLGTRRRRNR